MVAIALNFYFIINPLLNKTANYTFDLNVSDDQHAARKREITGTACRIFVIGMIMAPAALTLAAKIPRKRATIMDRFDPDKEPLKHLLVDSPKTLIGLLGAGLVSMLFFSLFGGRR